MRKATPIAAAVFVVLLAQGAGAAEMAELPAGPDRDLVSKTCTSCHDLQMVFDAAGISREIWDATLDQMADNGLTISAADRAKILNYLATYLGPSPPPTAGQ